MIDSLFHIFFKRASLFEESLFVYIRSYTSPPNYLFDWHGRCDWEPKYISSQAKTTCTFWENRAQLRREFKETCSTGSAIWKWSWFLSVETCHSPLILLELQWDQLREFPIHWRCFSVLLPFIRIVAQKGRMVLRGRKSDHKRVPWPEQYVVPTCIFPGGPLVVRLYFTYLLPASISTYFGLLAKVVFRSAHKWLLPSDLEICFIPNGALSSVCCI